jgi:capsular polysaccharide transport system ATP-binding protein
MIVFHDVTKVLGRGAHKHTVLGNINWLLEPRSRIAILGHPGSGKTTLLHLLSGAMLPTSGWIDRQAIVSSTVPLLRFGLRSGRTTRQLIRVLCRSYRSDPDEIASFVEPFANARDMLDIPLRHLPRAKRRCLSLALFYAFPCDYYLFERTHITRIAEMRERCAQMLQQRSKDAGMILATSRPGAALQFGGIGGVLYKGTLTFYESVGVAVSEFEKLVPPPPPTFIREEAESSDEEEEEF